MADNSIDLQFSFSESEGEDNDGLPGDSINMSPNGPEGSLEFSLNLNLESSEDENDENNANHNTLDSTIPPTIHSIDDIDDEQTQNECDHEQTLPYTMNYNNNSTLNDLEHTQSDIESDDSLEDSQLQSQNNNNQSIILDTTCAMNEKESALDTSDITDITDVMDIDQKNDKNESMNENTNIQKTENKSENSDKNEEKICNDSLGDSISDNMEQNNSNNQSFISVNEDNAHTTHGMDMDENDISDTNTDDKIDNIESIENNDNKTETEITNTKPDNSEHKEDIDTNHIKDIYPLYDNGSDTNKEETIEMIENIQNTNAETIENETVPVQNDTETNNAVPKKKRKRKLKQREMSDSKSKSKVNTNNAPLKKARKRKLKERDTSHSEEEKELTLLKSPTPKRRRYNQSETLRRSKRFQRNEDIVLLRTSTQTDKINVKKENKKLKRMGAVILDQYSERVSHIITTLPRTTLKFMTGLAQCKYIVTDEWCKVCIHKGNFAVDERRYLPRNEGSKAFEKEYGFVLKDVLKMRDKRGSALLFEGYSVYFTRDCNKNIKTGIRQMAEVHGAESMTRLPREFDAKLFVIGEDLSSKYCKNAKKKGYTVWGKDFVIASILRQNVETDDSELELV